MLKIVLDSNVLISAIVFGARPREILNLIIKGKVQSGISKVILEEIKNVLEAKKFGYPEHISKTILNEIENISELVYPAIKIKIITKDPDDNKILECAIKFKVHLIISGDIHLLELKKYKNITIVNPSEFLNYYRKNSS